MPLPCRVWFPVVVGVPPRQQTLRSLPHDSNFPPVASSGPLSLSSPRVPLSTCARCPFLGPFDPSFSKINFLVAVITFILASGPFSVAGSAWGVFLDKDRSPLYTPLVSDDRQSRKVVNCSFSPCSLALQEFPFGGLPNTRGVVASCPTSFLSRSVCLSDAIFPFSPLSVFDFFVPPVLHGWVLPCPFSGINLVCSFFCLPAQVPPLLNRVTIPIFRLYLTTDGAYKIS